MSHDTPTLEKGLYTDTDRGWCFAMLLAEPLICVYMDVSHFLLKNARVPSMAALKRCHKEFRRTTTYKDPDFCKRGRCFGA